MMLRALTSTTVGNYRDLVSGNHPSVFEFYVSTVHHPNCLSDYLSFDLYFSSCFFKLGAWIFVRGGDRENFGIVVSADAAVC